MRQLPKGSSLAGLVALLAISLAASQQCSDAISDDSVSLLQARSSVATRKGTKKSASIDVDELFAGTKKSASIDVDELFEGEDLHNGGSEQQLEAVHAQDLQAQAKAINLATTEHQLDKKLARGMPVNVQAWWAHRPYPWLTWLLPVGMCATLVAIFVLGQLLALSAFRTPRRNPRALPAGEAAMAGDLVDGADGSKPATSSSFGTWSCFALCWATPLFSVGARQSLLEIGNALSTSQPPGLSMTQPDNDPAAAHDRFQACWVQEVMRSQNGPEVRLVQVLRHFVGWRQLLLLAGLVLASFAVNCLAMVVSVEFLLGYAEWLRSQNAAGATPDPFWSSLLVLTMCGAMPLVGIVLEEVIRVRDARISMHLTAALTTAICQKVQRLPVASLQPDSLATPASTQRLVTNIAEASTSATRMLVQCAVAPVNMVLLLSLLWHRVGSSSMLVVIGFVPLVLVSTKFVNAIVPAKVAHKVAYDKWLLLFRNALNAILEVKACGWEAPLMKRISEARGERLNAVWTMQNMGQQIVTVSTAWPRLITFGVLASYSRSNPVVDGIALFTCLQVLGYMTYLISAFSSGTTKLKAILQLSTRVETFLQLAEAPASQPAHLQMEPYTGLALQGSFAWRANDKSVLRDLDLSLPKGTLTAVVGEAGSGKTSLLHAVLGHLYPKNDIDQKAVAHAAAYCAQSPWILGDTIRQNIVLGADEVDESRYQAAVRAAGLALDIEALLEGDATSVSAHGGILTESQRVRIAWARCAYSSEDLVLMDDVLSRLAEDPGSSHRAHVYTPEAVHKRLIHDPLLESRTRLVAVQADAALLEGFDMVIVMSGGQVVECGPPKDVLATHAFKKLLQPSALQSEPRMAFGYSQKAAMQAMGKQAPQCIEDVHQNMQSIGKSGSKAIQQCDADVSTSFGSLLHFLSVVGGRRVLAFLWLVFVTQALMLVTDISLGQWANEADNVYALRGGRPESRSWLWVYAGCAVTSVILGVVANTVGASCSQTFSNEVHDKLMQSLLLSPLQHVQNNSQPRANQIIADLYQADFTSWVKLASLASMVCAVLCPSAYVHAVLPVQFSIVAAPCYLAMAVFASSYWKVLPQHRRFSATQRSQLHHHIQETIEGASSRRAFGQQEGLATLEARIIRSYINSHLLVNCIGSQWLLTRLTACFVPVLATAALIGVLNPGMLGQGSFGLVLVFCISVLQSFEVGIEHCTAMQEELVVAERLHQAISAPQDSIKTQCQLEDSALVFEDSPTPLSDSTEGRRSQEARGLQVQIRSLCIGYSDHQIDVLRGLSLQIVAGQKVGVYGAGESGKSLLLLTLLQLVSPRHGAVMFNGADASKMDLKRLRSLVGLVPQYPILLQGDVAFNMDPLEKHSKKKIASALQIVGLDSLAQDLESKASAFETVAGRCSCPVFALRERRLLAVARMVLQQPALLLLDETLLGLDARAQALMRNTMQSAFADSTVLAVARAPELLMGFERISELKQGVLIERSLRANHE